jgi:hypothetical protein
LDIFETEKAKILELESNIERTLTRQSSSSADRTPLNSPSKKTRSLDANSTQKLYEEQLSPSSISVQNQLLAMFPNGKRVYLTPVCQDQFDKYAYLVKY